MPQHSTSSKNLNRLVLFSQLFFFCLLESSCLSIRSEYADPAHTIPLFGFYLLLSIKLFPPKSHLLQSLHKSVIKFLSPSYDLYLRASKNYSKQLQSVGSSISLNLFSIFYIYFGDHYSVKWPLQYEQTNCIMLSESKSGNSQSPKANQAILRADETTRYPISPYIRAASIIFAIPT